MCLQFSGDTYLLRTPELALTEYGDSLQSLVTVRLGNVIQKGTSL